MSDTKIITFRKAQSHALREGQTALKITVYKITESLIADISHLVFEVSGVEDYYSASGKLFVENFEISFKRVQEVTEEEAIGNGLVSQLDFNNLVDIHGFAAPSTKSALTVFKENWPNHPKNPIAWDKNPIVCIQKFRRKFPKSW